MKHFFIFIVFFFSITIYCQEPVYELVWSDEFDGNGAINSDNWHHQTLLPNGSSWYNGEIQHYTDRIVNSYVSDGTLKIVAKKEVFTDQGVTKEYTSARLNSKIAFTYGKVEVCAKLPSGVGTWPAIWTLGQNIIEPGGFWSDTFGTTFWPACGEIDIMEHWGSNQNFVQSAIHSPSSHGNTVNKGGQVIVNASGDFHVFTMEWTSEKIIFSVDDVIHYTYDPAVQNMDTWPFIDNQYILLNVAILPNIDPAFTESSMEIDYVRVYQEEQLATEDNKIHSVLTFPNPVNDTLKIQVPSEYIGAELEIFSILGQRMLKLEISAEKFDVNASGFDNGVYLLCVKNGGKSLVERFVKY